MAKVFIVNMSGHNHHLAKPLGELVPITSGYVSQGSLDRILEEVVAGVSQSDSEDWLLLSGLMFLNALATAIWFMRHGRLKLLVWDKKNRRYRQFHTDTEHIASLLEQVHGQDSDSRLTG